MIVRYDDGYGGNFSKDFYPATWHTNEGFTFHEVLEYILPSFLYNSWINGCCTLSAYLKGCDGRESRIDELHPGDRLLEDFGIKLIDPGFMAIIPRS